MVCVDVAIESVDELPRLLGVGESNVAGALEVPEDMLCSMYVRSPRVGHELCAGIDGVCDVRACPTRDVHQRADKLLVALDVVLDWCCWAVRLAEVDVWRERSVLGMSVLHVETLKHVLNVGALIDADGASVRVTCELHAEMPLEVALVRKLIFSL